MNGAVIICEHFQLSLGKVCTIFGTVGQVWVKRDGPGNGPGEIGYFTKIPFDLIVAIYRQPVTDDYTLKAV